MWPRRRGEEGGSSPPSHPIHPDLGNFQCRRRRFNMNGRFPNWRLLQYGCCVKVAVLIETASAALTFKVVIKTSRFNKHGPFSNGRLLKYGCCLKVTVLMETFSDALKVTVRIETPSVAGHLSVPPKAFD